MAAADEAPTAAALGAAVLYCETCRKETLHRILRVTGPASRGRTTVAGVARCRACRWTHPFVSAPETRSTVEVVLSSGPTSRRTRVELPPTEVIRVGEPLPGTTPAGRVRKIDLHDGSHPATALVRDVGTVWAVEDGPRLLRVAVLQGARSTTERLAAVPGQRLGVGDALRLPAGSVTIVALRAHGRTWRRPGDVFAAEEVGVVYGRRTVRPPAGRRGWSRERETPSSRDSSTSRDGRSRSSPGEIRNRTVPRARTASGGATQSDSSSS